MTQHSACSFLLSTGLASTRKTTLYLPCEGNCYRLLKSSTILSGTGHFLSFKSIWSTSGVLANWWTLLIIEATSHVCSQVTKWIKTLYIINQQSIINQELNIKFHSTQILGITKYHLYKTSEIFHWFHPLVQIFHTHTYCTHNLFQHRICHAFHQTPICSSVVVFGHKILSETFFKHVFLLTSNSSELLHHSFPQNCKGHLLESNIFNL